MVAIPQVMMLEIGSTPEANDAAATACEVMIGTAIRDRKPVPLFVLFVAAWDDDPREVWKIPEACACFCRFALALRLNDGQRWWRQRVLETFSADCCTVLVATGAWWPDPPIELRKVDGLMPK